jgi:hypothetical protein
LHALETKPPILMTAALAAAAAVLAVITVSTEQSRALEQQ